MNYKLNWSEAAKYGLILASVSVIINLVSSIFQLPALLNILLSLIKLGGSVYIVYYVMRRNAEPWDYISYGQSFNFGMAVCTFSAIVCTLFMLLTYTAILPDSLTALLDTMFATYESMGIAAAMDYDTLARSMPVILTLSQFIGCVICGVIVCLIMASFVRKGYSDPFNRPADNNTEE
ncbi:MAG TPA: DUF4199 domain-containing protein [Candidatus Coprenecus pullicola]|nr:DUF4199 domain-containing protein [Candidatus Coprenecus pullicola]